MKAVVEWGVPKHASGRPCGISGQFTAESPTQARMLASQLFHTLMCGRESVLNNKGAWGVSKDEPRKVVWATDVSCWVAVSLLDGANRGAYAGLADAEAVARLKPMQAKRFPVTVTYRDKKGKVESFVALDLADLDGSLSGMDMDCGHLLHVVDVSGCKVSASEVGSVQTELW